MEFFSHHLISMNRTNQDTTATVTLLVHQKPAAKSPLQQQPPRPQVPAALHTSRHLHPSLRQPIQLEEHRLSLQQQRIRTNHHQHGKQQK